MIRRKSEPRYPDISDAITGAWMMIFSDLLLLLLTFFVLRFSMLTLDGSTLERAFAKFSTVSAGEQRPTSTRLLAQAAIAQPQQTASLSNIVAAIADSLGQSIGEPQVEAESGGVLLSESSVRIESLDSTLVISLPDNSFPDDGVEPSFLAARTISALGSGLASEPVTIKVRTSTSLRSLATPVTPTSWELSQHQARVVMRQLIDAGVEAYDISAFGYGDLLLSGEDRQRGINSRVQLVVSPIMTR